jgi:hypothetical protein
VNLIDTLLAAYNQHDVEAFVRCYADPVTWRGPDGATAPRTRAQMRASFSSLFAQSPDLRARVTQRIQLGQWVIDVEEVSGLLGQDLSSVVIYRVVDGLVVEVIVLAGG